MLNRSVSEVHELFSGSGLLWFRITDLHAVWSWTLWSRLRTNPVLVKISCYYVILVHDVVESYFFMISIIVNYLTVCEEIVVEHPVRPRAYFYVRVFKNI